MPTFLEAVGDDWTARALADPPDLIVTPAPVALRDAPPAVEPLGFVAGLDLGQAADYTALAVAQVTRRAPPDGPVDGRPALHYAMSHLERFALGTPYPAIVERVGALCATAPLATPTPHLRRPVLAVDATGVGRPTVDLLRAARPNATLVAITITAGAAVTTAAADPLAFGVPKMDLVAGLVVLLQAGRLKIARSLPEAATLVTELLSFRRKVSLAGRDTFEAWRDGEHDDLVLAAALCCWAGERQLGHTPHVH
jgi:hypothetical protein